MEGCMHEWLPTALIDAMKEEQLTIIIIWEKRIKKLITRMLHWFTDEQQMFDYKNKSNSV